MKKIFPLLAALILLPACERGQGMSLKPFEETFGTPQKFQVCHGFGCTIRTDVSLNAAEWRSVLEPFAAPAANAQEERQQIAVTVGRMETMVQQKTGMNTDYAKATTFERDQDQMDCIDEAINTTRTLRFIEKAGMLRWNDVVDPVHRGYFVDAMWPHNSGAVKDKQTGQKYVIDSYYADTGKPADIVPLEIWLNNWSPERAGLLDHSSDQ
ncbi:MAG: hypothetical protein KDI61_09445 [Alphaproteobacteria bacterium]|nr:hypothetical protein [Alphaproteobacteria bacterium]MCB1840471.1 hypothetical protein [Alphaproteobacteria bacterium]